MISGKLVLQLPTSRWFRNKETQLLPKSEDCFHWETRAKLWLFFLPQAGGWCTATLYSTLSWGWWPLCTWVAARTCHLCLRASLLVVHLCPTISKAHWSTWWALPTATLVSTARKIISAAIPHASIVCVCVPIVHTMQSCSCCNKPMHILHFPSLHCLTAP